MAGSRVPAKVSALILAPDVEHAQGAACSGLLPLGQQRVFDYWLQAIKQCSRCKPHHEQVHILCSQASQPEVAAWATAAGLPASCITVCATSTGSGTATAEHPLLVGLQGLLQQQPGLAGQHLLVVDTSHVLEPGADLSRLVEGGVVRGADTLTSSSPLPGADLAALMQVSLADAGAPTCQVLSVSPASLAGDSPPADLAVLAPVLVTAPGTLQRHVAVALGIAAASQADIHATSHAAIAAAAAEVAADYSPEACAAADAAVAAAQPGLWQLLGAAVGVAAAGGHQVWHLPLDFFFCVAEQQEYDQVAAFFAEYLQAQGRLRQKVQGVAVGVEGRAALGVDGTIGTLTQKLSSLTARPTVATRPGAAAGPPPAPSVSELFRAFYEKQQAKANCKAAPAAPRDYKKLPNRFQDPSRWQPLARKQHSCYTTTSSEYGSRMPGAIDMPLVWSGAVGGFTTTFHGGCYVAMGLKTGMERSKVHKALDGAW